MNRKVGLLVLGVIWLIGLSGFVRAQESAAEDSLRIRIANFASDASGVFLLVNGQTFAELLNVESPFALQPGGISLYYDSPITTASVTFFAEDAEPNEFLLEPVEIQGASGGQYTLALVGSVADDNLQILWIDERAVFAEQDPDQVAGFIFINSLRGVPAFDVLLNGEVFVPNVGFGQASWTTATSDATGMSSVVLTSAPEVTLYGSEETVLEPIPGILYLIPWYGSYPGTLFEDYGFIPYLTWMGTLTITEGGAVTLGQAVKLTLDYGQRIAYTFTLENPATLHVRMEAQTPNGDAFFTIYDSSNEIVLINDEISFVDDNFDAGVEAFPLPSGTYILEAGMYNDAAPGDYLLVIDTVK